MPDEKAVFTSADGRGRSEIIRMMLAAAEIEYEEINVRTKEELADAQKDLLFGQIPSLKVKDKVIVQHGAIVRYLAREADMFGSDDDEMTTIDMLFEGTRDFMTKFYAFGFANDAKIKDELDGKVLPKYLPIFNKVLEQNRTGFLVSEDMTLADVGLMEVLLSIADYFGEERFAKIKKIKKFFKLMKEESQMRYYIDKIRKRPNDEQYVKEVKELFGQ